MSVWASVSADDFGDSAFNIEADPLTAVSEMDRYGASFNLVQYTDHSMRFEQPGSPGQKISDAPAPVEAPSSAGAAKTEKPAPPPRQKMSLGITQSSTAPVDSYGSIEGVNASYEEELDPFEEGQRVIPELEDPWTGFNHAMYNFNEALYDAILEPAVEVYIEFIHEDVRIAIRNLFRNALAPSRFVNSLLQGNFGKAGRVLGRVLINTVFGLGGLLDVAGQEFKIRSVNEDFGQTLGLWGVPTGPYIVLPFFGPSTARDTVGRTFDSFLSPAVIFSPGLIGGFILSGSEVINESSFNLEGKKQLEAGALDQYESIRDFYHQYREGLVYK